MPPYNPKHIETLRQMCGRRKSPARASGSPEFIAP
ncbi:Uncharacterised protein [Burkholderia pseudomallei]|nr:Uncharacterised protein [Burkholderia pseudomallei]